MIMEKMYKYCIGDPNQPNPVLVVGLFAWYIHVPGSFEGRCVENSDLPEYRQIMLVFYPTLLCEVSCAYLQ
jgi:hypothetical protein